MTFQENIIIQTSAEDIFKQYMNVGHWYDWDTDVKSSHLNGEFITGETGLLQPTSGPKSSFTLTEVIPNQSFTSQTKLPLCVIIFEHQLSEQSDGTQVIHRVTFEGGLSFLFGKLIGNQIKKGLPNALKGLKSACEAGD